MKRSVGVTLISVVSFIGSTLTLLIGVLVLVAMAVAPPPKSTEFPSPTVVKLILSLAALVYLLPAIWGMITSVGLFKLRNWARISVIVFSILLILMSGFSGLISLLMPMPPSTGTSPGFATAFRIGLGGFWLTLLGIGVWWVIFFTRPRVKLQFSTSGAPLPPATPMVFADPSMTPMVPATTNISNRPISVTVIACLLLFGCLFMPATLILKVPAVILTRIVTGWPAAVYYLASLAVGLYVGIGLLRLSPMARRVGVAYFSILLLNAAVFYIAPGASARMQSLISIQMSTFSWMRFGQAGSDMPFNTAPIMYGGAVMGLGLLGLQLYLLITRKQAYEAAAAAKR